jgi:RHS repeat-associated protein
MNRRIHSDLHELTHLNGRVYDPTIGRFLSVDLDTGDGTDSQRVNPYSYVNNRPLTDTDPTGYDPSLSLSYINDLKSDCGCQQIVSYWQPMMGVERMWGREEPQAA